MDLNFDQGINKPFAYYKIILLTIRYILNSLPRACNQYLKKINTNLLPLILTGDL